MTSEGSIADRVTGQLRDAIVSGRLDPGSEFSMREMAQRFEVSFIPVREAVRSLQTEGLVMIRGGRRPVVAPLDAQDLFGVHRLRQLIEPELAVHASQLLHPVDLERAEDHLARAADTALSDDERYAAHRDFHSELLRPALTPWDDRVLRMAWFAAERCVRAGLAISDRRALECDVVTTHGALLATFRCGEPDEVREIVREHLRQNLEVALRGVPRSF